jgi:hypothetical protein
MRRLGAPVAVALIALLVRALTAAAVTFPVPEDSAYYVAAARNLATGRGLITDAVWSYATPPLVVPRPAFDLWQPLAAFLAAPFMAVLGPSLAAAQVPTVLLGAAVAPLAWLVATNVAREIGLSPGRAEVVAFTSGLFVALAPLLVVHSAEPDSSAPYTALAVAACALIPASLRDDRRAGGARVLLGVALGLAYLARSDAVYVVAAYLLVAGVPRRTSLGRRLEGVIPTLAVAAIVVIPWQLRQATTWQASPVGQLVENAWSLRFGDIFAWAARPDLASYIAAGPATLIGLRVDAFIGDALLLLIAAFPAALVGVVAIAARPRLAVTQALRPLALTGVLTFAVDVLVFPVAGRAGLWAHGAGPAIVMLAISGALGLEAIVARVGAARSWQSPNGPFSRAGLIAPLAVAIVSMPLVALVATLEHERSTTTAAQYEALATASARWDLPADRPIVTDRPMWVSEALGQTALALPREPPSSVIDLMRHFRAGVVVVREDDPEVAAVALALAGYRDAAGRTCFPELPAVTPFRAFGFACATETATRPEA